MARAIQTRLSIGMCPKMDRRSLISALTSSVLISSCARESTVIGNVLNPGDVVEIRNEFGEIAVGYVSPTIRQFSWAKNIIQVALDARSEPFNGKQGLLSPERIFGARDPIIYEEFVMNFDRVSQLEAFLWAENKTMDWVYTNDGLVGGLGPADGSRISYVQVMQLLVDREKPTSILGSRPRKISIRK